MFRALEWTLSQLSCAEASLDKVDAGEEKFCGGRSMKPVRLRKAAPLNNGNYGTIVYGKKAILPVAASEKGRLSSMGKE